MQDQGVNSQSYNKLGFKTQAGRKRIFFFYNRPVQIRYAATALGIIAATILAYAYIIFHQVQKVIGISHEVVRTQDSEALGALAMHNLIQGIVWGSAVCLIVAGGTSAFCAMLITHRYEGPMSRITQHLRKLVNGNYDSVMAVRSTDEVATLIDAVNVLTKALKEKEADRKS